jgi:hypothetical protein
LIARRGLIMAVGGNYNRVKDGVRSTFYSKTSKK